MELLSLNFVIFLFVILAAYYLLYAANSKLFKKDILPQWVLLLIASLLFYGLSNYIYLIYIGISSLLSYLAGIICQYKKQSSNNKEVEDGCYSESNTSITEKNSRKNHIKNKIITIVAIVINVGILAVLKYYNFFIESINSIFQFSLITYNFIIPLGISFYTFSLIAYNVDCYKNNTAAEINPLKFFLFVSYFPKILQGPISSYDKLKKDGLFSKHSFTDIDFLKSFCRISIGLIKKIVIANVLNMYVNASYFNLGKTYGGELLLTSILYTIQLYCDFSGFADITIGVSGLFGIKLEENFNVPYISSSIQEFWRRWHITLGAWLKKYIYIPLGGNRVPLWRWIINTLIVWLVSGIWHGANWTFILWGLFHGILLVATGIPKKISKKNEKNSTKDKPKLFIAIFSIISTFFLVNFGWILFRSSSINEAAKFIWHMIKIWEPSSYSMFSDISISKANWLFTISLLFVLVLIVMKVLVTHMDSILKKFKNPDVITNISSFAITVIFFSVSILTFLYLKSIGGGESSFIYFEF